MKRLLALLLTLALVCTLAVPVLADEVTPEDDDAIAGAIVILHSNDVHGAIEGYAKMEVLKDFYKSRGAEVIVVDAGDFAQGDAAVSLSQGASAVKLMDLVGYDVAVPGNHDFEYGLENLQTLAKTAGFALLSANVTSAGDRVLEPRCIITTPRGTKVGFFGVTTPETASKLHPAKLGKLKFAGGEDLYAIAQAQVDALRAEGADYVVCLSHLGVYTETAASGNRSVDLLNAVEGIDVLIDGHSHSTPAQLAELIGEEGTVGKTHLTSTGTKFENIGAVIFYPDGDITLCNWPTRDIEAQPGALSDAIAQLRAQIAVDYGTPFAKSKVDLNGARAPGNRTEETNAGDLVADAILWAATKEPLDVPSENVIALINGGGIRESIAAGEMTKNDVNTMLPFDNTVCVVYVPGRTLLEALEAATFCTPEPLGAFPQVAGIQFTVDATREYEPGELYGETTYYAPAAIERVSIQSVNGKAFDPETTYAVVTNDFVAAGGDVYYALSVSPRITDTGIRLSEAVMDYIDEVLGGIIGQQYAKAQGRITILQRPEETPEAPDTSADLDPGAWYYAAARDVMQKGIMQGTDKGFEPQGTVTRATVFQTLYNLEGRPAPAPGEVFVTGGDFVGKWYEPAALWAYATGLTTGTGGGFAGDRAVTRSEIVTVLYRYAQYKGRDVSIGEETNILSFEDAENVPAWAVPAFQWAVGSATVSGKSGVWLAPTDTATRAELAQILSNYTTAPEISPEPETPDAPDVPKDVTLTGKSVKLDKYGNVFTDITAADLDAAGLQPGDILTVQVGDRAPIQVPFVTDCNDVDFWKDLLVVDEDVARLGINMGDFATAYGVGSRGDSVFSYVMTEQPITISLAEKDGYASALALRSLGGECIETRAAADSDEAYANFRAVAAGDIAEGVLYRSASPIQPDFDRARYADRLLGQAGVRTIVDMADCRAQAPEYKGFADTEYAKVHNAGGTVYLNMGSDMYTQVGLDDLKNGLDFMTENEGPYLIHCHWGKDRTGHMILLLEALMGAEDDEIVADYMASYENLYGIAAESETWKAIAAGTVEAELGRLRKLAGTSDLAAAAEKHMIDDIGLSASQVALLRERLSK